jgi:hypothetical protein
MVPRGQGHSDQGLVRSRRTRRGHDRECDEDGCKEPTHRLILRRDAVFRPPASALTQLGDIPAHWPSRMLLRRGWQSEALRKLVDPFAVATVRMVPLVFEEPRKLLLLVV